MHILYGVSGEGMGHAIRSAVCARHLERQGHRITFASSGPALDYLKKSWPSSLETVGLTLFMDGNRVAPIETAARNLFGQLLSPLVSLPAFSSALSDRPELVISDFDHWSAHIATLLGAPLLSVDNIHFLTRCIHPAELGDESAAMAEAVSELMVPGAKHYFVTSFAPAQTRSPNTTLHKPILRDSILQAKRSVHEGHHVLAYFNSNADHQVLTRALALSGVHARAYGMPGIAREMNLGNLTLCPFSDETFIEDLATSRAVVGGAGFTLMSEAIFLGKPMLALPFENQYEQILSAGYLERLGYGERARNLDASTILAFLHRAPYYANRLKSFSHDGNRELFAALDRKILESR